MVASSIGIVRLAFRFGHTPRSAIIRVQLRSHSDLYLTQTAELVSLVPGTIVVEARRATSTLYLHVLDAVSDDDLASARPHGAGRRGPGDPGLRFRRGDQALSRPRAGAAMVDLAVMIMVSLGRGACWWWPRR